MKLFHYFVSFQYNNGEDRGFGQINLLMRDRIIEADQLEEIRDYLMKKFNYQGVVLINFQLLREEEREEIS